MDLESSGGKEECATRSLNALCGSGVMRQIEKVGEVFSECGRNILPGLSRGCGTMCFLVARTSHIGWAPSKFDASPVRRSFFSDVICWFRVEETICLSRAEEALSV